MGASGQFVTVEPLSEPTEQLVRLIYKSYNIDTELEGVDMVTSYDECMMPASVIQEVKEQSVFTGGGIGRIIKVEHRNDLKKTIVLSPYLTKMVELTRWDTKQQSYACFPDVIFELLFAAGRVRHEKNNNTRVSSEEIANKAVTFALEKMSLDMLENMNFAGDACARTDYYGNLQNLWQDEIARKKVAQ